MAMMQASLRDHLERSKSWGGSSTVLDYVYRPNTVAELCEVLELGQRMGLSVGMRGAGRSYGDAALNGEHLLLDLSHMNRILNWDAETGVATVEPGVTISQLWQHVLADGWWPPVVPGTMYATLGGCAAMNIHGKNHWQVGTLGDHILGFSLLLATGEVVECSRRNNEDVFSASIGSFGMLGCFTKLSIKMKRVKSGLVRVKGVSVSNMEAMLDVIEDSKDKVDYVVGWVDGLSSGRSCGRGQVHTATYVRRDTGSVPDSSLSVESQQLPRRIMGVIPRRAIWRLVKPFTNKFGMRLINTGKYWLACSADGHSVEQSLARFNFLLDFVPDWEKGYLPGGLIQYQSFIAYDRAAQAFRDLLMCCRSYHVPPMLCVVKRHRRDDFLVSCGVDGFSMAMDFQVTDRTRERLVRLSRAMDEVVINAGGRFYLAKDSTLHPSTARTYLGGNTISQLAALKKRCDPEGLLQTNLSRRVVPDLHSRSDKPSSL